MKALTIWQPWASLIMLGVKSVEWRGWRAPRFAVGQRFVVHASMVDPRGHIRDLLTSDTRLRGSMGPNADLAKAKRALERFAAEPTLLPRGAGLGTACLGESMRGDVLLGITPKWGEALNFAWPLYELHVWEEPVPCRGAQGFWDWPLPVAEAA